MRFTLAVAGDPYDRDGVLLYVRPGVPAGVDVTVNVRFADLEYDSTSVSSGVPVFLRPPLPFLIFGALLPNMLAIFGRVTG